MLSLLYTILIVLLLALIGLNTMLFLRIKSIWRNIKVAYVLCSFIVLGSLAWSAASPSRMSEEWVMLIGIVIFTTMLSGSIVSWSKTQVAEFTEKKTKEDIEHFIENGFDNGK